MVSAAAGAAQQQQAWMPLREAATQPMAYFAAENRTRVRQNAQPLGITWIIYGVYRIIGGLVAAFVVGHLAYGGLLNDAPTFLPRLLSTLAPVIATISVVMGLASVLVGYGILARQQWGRILAIVFGFLTLIRIPFGTALGIYTLWVFLPGASATAWQELARENR